MIIYVAAIPTELQAVYFFSAGYCPVKDVGVDQINVISVDMDDAFL